MPRGDDAPARVANRVRALRRARALTQQDLGDLLGVSRQTVNAIENGRYDPGLHLAFDIAAAFAARVEDVFRPAGRAKQDLTAPMIAIPDRLDAAGAVLRPHRPSDLPAFERFLLDPEATRHMAFTPEQTTPEGAAAMMDAVIGSYAGPEPICSLTIADGATDAYLGAAGGAPAGAQAMEVFVTLLPEARGRGHAAAAMNALAGHLFATSGATELLADVALANAPALRLFETLGYARQGDISRAARDGALAHREMDGARFVLTRARHRKAAS
ncbi:MAG: GNAT family N-acetyltransferase [Paracoccaceae bacterium]